MPNLIGQSLGRYHILEQLGEGGMATVYKAYDTRLERDVALKIIRRDAFPVEQHERILKRFEREAKSLAKLTHPNIVGVIDYGEYEDSPYLVMIYLPGGTLKQRLGKPMPWTDAVRLLLPIAEALQYAHEHGILHRDVKPSNILLTEKNQPLLTDFGIAKILDLEDGQTLTGTGVGIGTPEYMAPEQWTGHAGPQADIYSLGVVLYELITGRKPYVADTPAAILLKQAGEPLPPPHQYMPGLPEKVEKVLIKALASKPENRYPDMNAFATVLENLLTSTADIQTQVQQRNHSPAHPERTASVEDTQATIDQVMPREKARPIVRPPFLPTESEGAKMWLPWAGGAFILIVLLASAAIIYKYWNAPIPTATAVPSGTYTPLLSSTTLPTETATLSSSPLLPTETSTPTAAYRLVYQQWASDSSTHEIYSYDFSTNQATRLSNEPLNIGYSSAWNQNNQIAYLQNTNTPYRDIFIFDARTGLVKNVTNNPERYYSYSNIAWAPDEQSLAMWIDRGTWEKPAFFLNLYDLKSGTQRQIYSTNNGINPYCLTWFAANKVAYNASADVLIMDTEEGRPVNVTRNGGVNQCGSISNSFPKFLAVSMSAQPSEPNDIFIINLDTLEKQRITTGLGSYIVVWSPDDHYLAGANSKGLFTYSLDTNQITQTEIQGISSVIWSPDGTKVVFIKNRLIQSLDVDTGEVVTLYTAKYDIPWHSLVWIKP
jgi:serine/threonine protein kinase